MEQFDLIVLGTGSGGSSPALKCRAAGWRVAIIDDQPYGGTCAVRGCDPKKVLVGAAEVVSWHRRMQGHGVAGDAFVDWTELMRFKRGFTDPVPVNTESAFTKAGIETLHGEAHFIGEDRLRLESQELVAKHIVIATGAGPRHLNIPGENLLISSTQFLELDRLPPRILFVGVGYVSLEFAHVARRAGSEVTLIGRGSPLPSFDAALVDRLLAHTRDLGIEVILDADVTQVESADASNAFRVHASGPDGERIVEVDVVVHGAGRVPNTARLGTLAGNVRLDAHGAVEVNEFLQSVTNPRVYAAGDVVLPGGSIPLTPVAAHEGATVASNLLHGNKKTPDYRGIPSVVFTDPPLAGVGMTESSAREHGVNVKVKTIDTSSWYSNRRIRQSAGLVKTVIDADSDKLLGAHLLGAHSDEVINLFALAVRFGISARELRHMIYAYPTGGSDIPYML